MHPKRRRAPCGKGERAGNEVAVVGHDENRPEREARLGLFPRPRFPCARLIANVSQRLPQPRRGAIVAPPMGRAAHD